MPYSFTHFRLRASVIMFSLLLCSSVMADTKQAAVGTIERLHETLLAVMQQASNLGFKGRVKKLKPVVEE